MATTKNSTTKNTAEKSANLDKNIQVKRKALSPKKRSIKKEDEVEVYSIFPGILTYINNRTGETIRWGEYGDFETLTIADLIHMRNSQKAFFENPWIMINDPDILKYLRVDQYYEGIPKVGDIENLFDLPIDIVSKKIKNFTDSTKFLIAQLAARRIESGEIDSVKMISALEESLGIELVEH